MLIAGVCTQLFNLFLEDHQVLAALTHAHSLYLQNAAREAGLADWELPLSEDIEDAIFPTTW
jgi:hypothetical protein